MDKQQAFDAVVECLADQGGPSLDRFGACMYRSEGGRRCAVGCLIPDDRYDPYWEGKRVHNVPALLDLLKGEVGADSLDLMSALQSAHDGARYRKGVDGAPASWADPWRPRVEGVDLSTIAGGVAYLLEDVAKGYHLDASSVEAKFPRDVA